jgi:hypothetical protein
VLILAFLTALILSFKAYIFEFLESIGILEKTERVGLSERNSIIKSFREGLSRLAE